MSVLKEIFDHKRVEVARRKRTVSQKSLEETARQAAPPLDFAAALRHTGMPALIAEVKRASPSKGVLAQGFDPLRLARLYAQNGAAAISVLTDERYFMGSLEDLRHIASQAPRLPLLRKDFIFDAYQVFEARFAGADAILLIAAALAPDILRELHALALLLGMAPLVEVHREEELETALTCDPLLIGINNRDLSDFSVNLETTLRLRPLIPSGVCVVSESGIHTPQDAARLAEMGVDAILVGEALVTAPDPAAAVRHLAGVEAPV